MPESPEAREAAWGKRMTEVRVRFWTDKIAEGRGTVIPTHAWDGGVVVMQPNIAHGIEPNQKPLTFNSLAVIPAKIEQAFITNGIQVHRGSKSRKYQV